MLSEQAHAAVLRRVATTAIADARAAWRRAREHPDEKHTREAFRLCVFAARSLRTAAHVLPRDRRAMLAEAKKLEAAADDLKARLVRIVEG